MIQFPENIILNKRFGVIIITVLGTLVLLFAGCSFYSRYFKKPPTTDTKVIVKQINRIAQLFTYSYYDECVAMYPVNDPRYIIIAKGTVIAGFNLSGLKESSLKIEGNTLDITVGKPEIISVIVNPSGFETFMQKGDISYDRRRITQEAAIEILKKNALDKGILKSSEEQGIIILKKFFESAGFDEVNIH